MTKPAYEPCDCLELGEDEVHVRFCRLDVEDAALAYCETLLSPDELARANRYRFARDRRRFAVARGWLRIVLSAYAGIPAPSLTFSYTEFGKPFLGNLDNVSIAFNLSHSDDFAAFAVTKNIRVGIDIESGGSLSDCRSLAKRFFHPTEVEELGCLPEAEYRSAFLHAWTRKEALLKAIGTGLHTCLRDALVSVLPDEPPRIRQAPDNGCWNVYSLDAGSACTASLVTEGCSPMRLRTMNSVLLSSASMPP